MRSFRLTLNGEAEIGITTGETLTGDKSKTTVAGEIVKTGIGTIEAGNTEILAGVCRRRKFAAYNAKEREFIARKTAITETTVMLIKRNGANCGNDTTNIAATSTVTDAIGKD